MKFKVLSISYFINIAQLSLVKILCLLILCTAGLVEAKTEKSRIESSLGSKSSGITQNQIKIKIDELNKQSNDEPLKSELLTLYQTTQENLTKTESYGVKSVEFEEAIKQAPEKIKKLQREIDQGQQKLAKQRVDEFAKISDEELEQRLILEKEKVGALDEQIKKLDKDLAVQNDRPQLIRQETITAQQAIDATQAKLDTLAATPIAKRKLEAQQFELNTQIDSRTAELKMLSAEANSNLVRVELLKAELQSLNIQKDLLNPIIAAIENLLNERRQKEAINLQNALTQAEKQISGKHSLIQQATRENIQYSRDLQAITAKIESYNERKNKVDATAKEIENDFKSAEKKIGLAGLSPVLGKILREQRRNLASQDQLNRESDVIQEETALTSLEQFKLEDKLKSLTDLDSYLKDLMVQQVDQSLPAENRMMIQAELRVLLNNQKELLNKLSAADSAYLRTLGEYDFANQQMQIQVKKFAGYLDEHLLWVRSSAPINSDFLPGLYHSIRWLLSPLNWLVLVKDTALIAWQNLFLTFIALIASAGLPIVRNWAKQQLTTIAEKIEKIYTDNFNYTLKAFGYTLILVLPLPVFIYFLGWFLSSNSLAANFSKAIGVGLQSTAVPLFVLQFFYRLFSANGMAVRHFQWQKASANLFRIQFAWLRFVIVPGVFLINSTGASSVSSHSDSLGRLALILVMIALSVFFARLLNPATGLLQIYFKNHPDDWLAKLRYIWYPLIISIPLIISGFAVTGYYLSALELQQKLIITIRLIFIIVIFHGMVIRWLTFVNRKLALKNARQKRKAAALSEKPLSTKGVGGDDPALPVDEELIDIPTINAQTIKLLIMFIGFSMIVGVWMIWSNILPAFSFFDQIVLWQHIVTIDNQESVQPVTLKNLFMAGLYVFIVVVSVRNFSGVMELLLFSRISIAAGGRYAVNQLAKYLIISIGFICIANELGGSWSQVQWLVAALSVGLGFGLQEIFANLVSGIILLFERPIRVGDTVTISNVTGKVSRIQMRATTLLDPDQKELIVPNKTFITTQLINWTLSDSTTRVVFPIFIAHGSDVELAQKVMIDAVRATPLVLEEPGPGVVFTGFGVDALEFSIRVFVSELSHRLPVNHNLHMNIEKALRENNIQMPK